MNMGYSLMDDWESWNFEVLCWLTTEGGCVK